MRLVPEDTQIGNWEYALKSAPDDESDLKALRDFAVLKVGHYGSRNATPRALFREIAQEHSAREDKPQFLMLTMLGKHGHKENYFEIPWATPVTEMKRAGNSQSVS